jgi:beta-glucosidase
MNTHKFTRGWPLAVLASVSFVSSALAESSPKYLDKQLPVEVRVEDLLARLTLEEKIKLCHADSKFTTAAIPRLGIPRRWLSDGPHGVREDVGPDTWAVAGRTDDFATAMPCGIALAATWNPELAQREGEVIGQEARKRGKDIMLGPGLNIMRSPLCGRNFEYFGEDPLLAGSIAVGYINGVQSQGVASCAKHFAVNDQETDRNKVNVEVDERALREIHLPAFRMAVREAKVWTVMGAYNKLRGVHCCESDYLLNRILKGEWGFQGLVVSDWAGVHSTRGAVLGGLDLEMGTDQPYDEFFLARPFREGVQNGEFSMSVLDDKVRRNLRVMIGTGVLDQRPEGSLNTKAHQDIARRVAEEAIVLLKNEKNFLPFNARKLKTVAVIGENATRLQTYGGDSSRVKAFYEVTPLAGILNRIGTNVNVTYSEGYRQAGDAALAERAIAAAKAADVVIYVGGINHDVGYDSEGGDKQGLELPFGQDELIQKLAQANPKIVVVLVGGSPMEMDAWLGKVPAVLLAWYSGMEGGNAIANVLFGDVNPSGKLPATFPKRLADSPAHSFGASGFPGVDGTVKYSEGILVGYRWFDTKKIEPLFPFGFGLSYTTFKYSDFKLIPGTNGAVTAQFEVENTGKSAGAEVAQLYVHQNKPAVARPEKELKGFQKVSLKPGERRMVSIPLDKTAFSYFDDRTKSWVADEADFDIWVGSSSRDLRLRQTWRYAESSQPAQGKAFHLYPPYYAFKNNWSGRDIGWHPGTEDVPQWTASFNFTTNSLYGYPASARGWHYGWNPTGDNLFPRKVSDINSLPCSFSWDCGGEDLRGNFAYDLFLRWDDRKAEPQLEVMVWGANNSTPIGQVIATNILEADGVSFDLWAGPNAPAGYYVYSFTPHSKTEKLGGPGSLNVDLIPFLDALNGRDYFSPGMYIDVVEAGFEIVRGKGWATCGWFSCEAE